jgi:hypothetical protein
MSPNMTVEQLLVWRLAQAEADAPPAPRAERLLDLVLPWWPERCVMPPYEPDGGADTSATIGGRRQ